MTGDEERYPAPDGYALVRASRYLGVAPWELARQPLAWTAMALEFEAAESEAAEALSKGPQPIGGDV